MPRARSLLLLLVVHLAAFARPALAAPDAAQLKKAKELFDRGQAAHNAGKYDEALEAYRGAYDAAPLPALLFNIGQAYRLKGDKRHAVEYYKLYLEKQPGGQAAVEAQSHLQVLGREIDAEDAAARDKAAAEERARAVEEARQKEREAARAEAEAAAARQQAAPVEGRQGGGRGLKIAGLVTGGAGVLLIGAGVYFGLRASSLQSDQDALGPGDAWDPSLAEDGKAANRNMLICTIAGGAALATGGVLYYLGMRSDRGEAVAVTPVVGGEAAGLVVSGRW